MSRHIHEVGQIILAVESYIRFDNQVLMQKRSETSDNFPGFWIPPGGHMDEDEDPLTSAIREVEEETGVVVTDDEIKLKAVSTSHHLDLGRIYLSFIFLADLSEHQETKEGNSEGRAAWVDQNDLFEMENVFPPVKYYFDHVLNDKPGIMYGSLQWKNFELVNVSSERVDKDS